ncbi:gamma carbonic anhydrase family protein [Roseomonas gilardii]|uniref:gamma carbonic anhydrase family protein n=1 Tax=Roseomonas gilardii TaxID=257708 RepID=UPI0009E03968|nr:gamma carbonic anhydrase family protein [Roseomonas gilardii]
MALYALDGAIPTLPKVGRFWIAPDAQVIGDVVLAEDVSFWFGSVARGDNTRIAIGARTNIQEGALLHSDPGAPLTIGADVTVGHHAILHGCTVGDRSLIGMGATVLNKARIGRCCIIGANALVTEGKEFPDFSLIVGAPAKIVRTLDPTVEETLLTSAAHYVENWRRFSAGLRKIG